MRKLDLDKIPGKIAVPIDKLEPGMVVAEEIKLNDKVFIASDVKLTDRLIEKLKKLLEDFSIKDDVKIFNPERYKNIDIMLPVHNKSKNVNIRSNQNVLGVEMYFQAYTRVLGELFTNINYKADDIIKEIKKLSMDIQMDLHYPAPVVKNIVLYGSGGDYLYRHSVNVSILSFMLGKWLGLSGSELELLTYSALLHDFGKTKLDCSTLNKSTKLSPSEFKHIMLHPILGYEFMKKIPSVPEDVLQGILMHHERLDGSGYPLKLKEERIHNFAKIIAIADIFEAINSNRIYKKRRSPFEALETIKSESLGKLDYNFCKVFIENISSFYVGEKVLLNTKKVGTILKIDYNNLTCPLISVGSEFINLAETKDVHVKKLIL